MFFLLELVMKKILIIFLVIFYYSSSVYAGMEGSGKLKLNPTVLKYFKEYLDTKDHNKTSGSTRHGRGWFFFVAESGEEFGYSYCQQGSDCVMNPTMALRGCKKNVKKYLKRKERCYLFAKQRYIVWGGKKIRFPNKVSSADIDNILRENNFID